MLACTEGRPRIPINHFNLRRSSELNKYGCVLCPSAQKLPSKADAQYAAAMSTEDRRRELESEQPEGRMFRLTVAPQ
jgi:hypothetical protein